MFEPVVVEVEDATACADALVGTVVAERRAVAERLLHVAAWADFHSGGCELGVDETDADPRRQPTAARQDPGFVGGDGTPPVSSAGVVELGMLMGAGTYSARKLLGDVLDLRHRLPEHWEAVLTGRLDAWKAREVARMTRHLSFDRARAVDDQVIDAALGLPWGRAKDVVEGRVIAADPAAHEARLAADENRRFVSTRRRSNAAGLRTVVARADAGGVAQLEAMVAHLAQLLADAGDTDSADTRRAKGLAMLANPALTCVFLADRHAASPADAVPDPDATPGTSTAADEALPDNSATQLSAVELAAHFGRMLKQLGDRALDRLRPRSVLYVHLSEEALRGERGTQVARVDDAVARGPIGVEQLRDWLRNHRVTVKPVLDPTGVNPVDEYVISAHLRESLALLTPFESFPYGTASARSCDADHSSRYVPMEKGGPPGQTGLHNLGPLGRRHHLAKTFDGFRVHQVAIGVYYWRSPTGYWWLVDPQGTRALGRLEQPPDAVTSAERLDPTPMRPAERRFRDLVVRSLTHRDVAA